MATYLLDTCVALWIFEGSPRISPDLRDRLTDPSHDLLLSDASLLEIVIKHGLGKLPLPRPPSELIPTLAARHMMDPLPLSAADIWRIEKLSGLHRDPFDRLLVAQALERGLELVTPDPKIQEYDVPVLWM